MKTLYVRATADDADDMVVVVEVTPEVTTVLAAVKTAFSVASEALQFGDSVSVGEPYALDVWFRVPAYDADDVIFPGSDEAGWEVPPWELSDGVTLEEGAAEQRVNYVILSADEDGFKFRMMLHHATAEYSTEEVPWDFDAPDAPETEVPGE